MTDYCIGSTGVAQLHISFAKQDKLVALPKNEILMSEQHDIKMSFDNKIFKNDSSFKKFESSMNKKINGRQNIGLAQINIIILEIAKFTGVSASTLKKRYLERYCKKYGISVPTYRNEREWRYQQNYRRFNELRSKHPNYAGYALTKLNKDIANEIGLKPETTKGVRYEYRWRKENDIK